MERLPHDRLIEILRVRFDYQSASAVAEWALSETGLVQQRSYSGSEIETIALWLEGHRQRVEAVVALLRAEIAGEAPQEVKAEAASVKVEAAPVKVEAAPMKAQIEAAPPKAEAPAVAPAAEPAPMPKPLPAPTAESTKADANAADAPTADAPAADAPAKTAPAGKREGRGRRSASAQ